MIAAPCVAEGIVEHVSENLVCHAPVVVRAKAKLLHAQPTVVLGKAPLDIESHPGPCTSVSLFSDTLPSYQPRETSTSPLNHTETWSPSCGRMGFKD
jgi:hypothetical protein